MISRRSVMIGGALALAGVAPAFAQSPDLTKLREELMALEKGSWGFMRDKNYEGMKNFLADDGLLIFWDGSRFNKRQTLELMKDFTLVGDIAIEPTYAVRLITPDVATLLYRVTYTSSVKGGPAQTVMVLSSSLYVLRSGKWWSVLYQESSIK
ncbi:MAG TPA: DUF4440 domain-containing protein [Reyranella sp.]|nr:DUF4440 domain-containing protein [Reyranella sp.]